MTNTVKNYQSLLGMEGFSDTLLKNHFILYQGYVTHTNKVTDKLTSMLKEGKAGEPEYAELKRRFGWEFNGMRLHEYYFDNLGGKKPVNPNGKLGKALLENFGSWAEWEKDFRSTGMMRGIGWVILYQDLQNNLLFNQWINEHDTGHAAGCHPILVLDVFEHAFMADYQLKKVDYVAAFFKNINWEVVEKRLK